MKTLRSIPILLLLASALFLVSCGDNTNEAEEAGGQVGDALKDGAEAVKDGAKGAVDKGKDVAAKTGDAIKDGAEAVKDGAKGVVDKGKNVAGKTGDAIKDGAEAVKDGAKGAVEKGKDAAGKTGDAIKDGAEAVKDGAKGAVEKGKDAAGKAGDAIKDGAEAVKDGAKGALEKGKDAVQGEREFLNKAYSGELESVPAETPTEFQNKEVAIGEVTPDEEAKIKEAKASPAAALAEQKTGLIRRYISPGNWLPWFLILLGLGLVLIDYLFPVDWPAFIGYALFALGIFGACGFHSISNRLCLAALTFVSLLVLHQIYLTRFLTNADEDEEPVGA